MTPPSHKGIVPGLLHSPNSRHLRVERRTLSVQRSPTHPSRRKAAASAFTLIETALAMLAIGLGLVALFGLGRLGLRATKETDHDQRCALMADAVFETLRETNARFVDEARTNRFQQSWSTRWVNAIATANQVAFPPVADMCTSRDPALDAPLYLIFSLDRNNLVLANAYDNDSLLLTEWNPRYTLLVEDRYSSTIANGINVKQVTLLIYPDGDTYSSEQRIFQTTLSNPGGLP